MLLAPCTNSLTRLRRGRHTEFRSIIHCRAVSWLAVVPCWSRRYSVASVGPKPRSISRDSISIASCSTASSPHCLNPLTSRFTRRTLKPNSSAVCLCVIVFAAFRRATCRSLSTCAISSCSSATPPAWGCQGDMITLPLPNRLRFLSFPACRPRPSARFAHTRRRASRISPPHSDILRPYFAT